MCDAVGQRSVGARAQGNMVMAFLGAIRLEGIDCPEYRAFSFGLLNLRPQMHIAGNRITAPNHDQLGSAHRFGVHADRLAHAQFQSFAARRRTYGALQQTRTQCMKKSSGHALALYLPHRPGVAVRQYAFRVVAPNFGELFGNPCVGFIP